MNDTKIENTDQTPQIRDETTEVDNPNGRLHPLVSRLGKYKLCIDIDHSISSFEGDGVNIVARDG